MSNKRETWNPFEGELMSIQDYAGGFYYVEVPDLKWSGVFNTAALAFSRALAEIEEGGSEDPKTVVFEEERARLIEESDALHRQIDALTTRLAILRRSSSETPDLSDEREIEEQKAGIRRVLDMYFGTGSPISGHKRVAINIYKDYDADGDLDVSYSVTSSKKKFVE